MIKTGSMAGMMVICFALSASAGEMKPQPQPQPQPQRPDPSAFCSKRKPEGTFGVCGWLSERVLRASEILPMMQGDQTGLLVERVSLIYPVLRRARLSRVQFIQSVFLKADARELIAEHSVWKQSHLRRARMDGAYLAHSDLRGVKAAYSTWSDTDLRETRWAQADLSFADFRGADLRGADLRDALVIGARWERALIDIRTRLPFDLEQARQKGMVLEKK